MDNKALTGSQDDGIYHPLAQVGDLTEEQLDGAVRQEFHLSKRKKKWDFEDSRDCIFCELKQLRD